MHAYLELVGAMVAYAIGLVSQTVAAQRAERRNRVDPGLLARLATDRLYMFGFTCQALGFVLAFLARGNLPLYLVQAALTGSVALGAILGAILLGWRVRTLEIVALAVTACGLVSLAAGAAPSQAGELVLGAQLGLGLATAAVMLLAIPVGRLTGPRSAVALGALSGIAFGVVAVASRPLASGPVLALPLSPMFWLMVLAAAAGQSLFAAALQRGSATSASAGMTAVATVVASLAGLLMLDDQIKAGYGPFVAAGLLLVVGGVVWLSAVSRPPPHSLASKDRPVHGTRSRRDKG